MNLSIRWKVTLNFIQLYCSWGKLCRGCVGGTLLPSPHPHPSSHQAETQVIHHPYRPLCWVPVPWKGARESFVFTLINMLEMTRRHQNYTTSFCGWRAPGTVTVFSRLWGQVWVWLVSGQCCSDLSSHLILQLCWDIVDTGHCASLRCAVWWLDTCLWCRVFAPPRPPPPVLSPHVIPFVCGENVWGFLLKPLSGYSTALLALFPMPCITSSERIPLPVAPARPAYKSSAFQAPRASGATRGLSSCDCTWRGALRVHPHLPVSCWGEHHCPASPAEASVIAVSSGASIPETMMQCPCGGKGSAFSLHLPGAARGLLQVAFRAVLPPFVEPACPSPLSRGWWAAADFYLLVQISVSLLSFIFWLYIIIQLSELWPPKILLWMQ